MPLQICVSYALYALGFFSAGCFSFFCILYWKRERAEKRRIAQTREGIEDVTGLFQTMRGIVEQQKQLAAAFNEDIDKKMQMVKQVLSQSLSRNEELYEHQRLLTRELETVALELKSIQRQIGELDEVLPSGKSFERPRPFNAFHSHSERVPETPSNPEKARDAFRVMLQSQSKEEKAPFPSADGDAENKRTSDKTADVQQQVEELYASGMEIGAIAEKLNIGKGEVRLILSLKEH